MFSGHLASLEQKKKFFFHARPPMKVDSSACLMESRPWLAIPNSHACMQKLLLNLNAPLASCSCIYACNAPTNCPIGSLCCVHRDRAIHHTRRHSSRPGVGPAALLQSAVEGDKSFNLNATKAKESLAESIVRQPVTSPLYILVTTYSSYYWPRR